MGKNVATANSLMRAQRELKMVQRTVILVTILSIVGFPYTIIILMGIFNHPPKYQYRISYVFAQTAGLATAIVLFQFTDQLKASVMKIIKWRPNRIGV
jgi:hypothetical protein